MRRDLAHKITEPARYGSRSPNAGTSIRANHLSEEQLDSLPQRQGMGMGYHRDWWEEKCTSSTYPMIEKILRAQVGRPWDDVYGEVRRLIPASDAAGGLDAMCAFERSWLVETDCYEEDGKILRSCMPCRSDGTPYEVTGLYVHPMTGILSWKEPKKWKRPKAVRYGGRPEIVDDEPTGEKWENPCIEIDHLTRGVMRGGIWYIYSYGVREKRTLQAMTQVTDYSRADPRFKWRYMKKQVMGEILLPELEQVSIKQMNRKELRKYGLKNQAGAGG